MSNITKGRKSYDSTMGNTIVPFFNRNVTPYPTEAGGPKFDLVPVTKQKDIMINNARLYAQQEYDRIMELVAVLEKQAEDIKRRLDMTDLVHSCTYDFQLSMGHIYWVVKDTRKDINILTAMSPTDWSSGVPVDYEYLIQVRYLGDHTWMEINK
jgi:Protein of unknown function (DUF2452)